MNQVQQTAHWTAVIATIAVSVCLGIAMVALAIVVGRDGNTSEVTDALSVLGNIGQGLAITLGILVAGPQAVSAIISRFFPNTAPAAPVAGPSSPSSGATQ